jgi:hypothetical protein
LTLKQSKFKVTSPRCATSRTGATSSEMSQIIACKKFTSKLFQVLSEKLDGFAVDPYFW